MTPWTVTARLLSPWYSPGQNTGVGCPALLQAFLMTQRCEPASPVSHLLHLLYPCLKCYSLTDTSFTLGGRTAGFVYILPTVLLLLISTALLMDSWLLGSSSCRELWFFLGTDLSFKCWWVGASQTVQGRQEPLGCQHLSVVVGICNPCHLTVNAVMTALLRKQTWKDSHVLFDKLMMERNRKRSDNFLKDKNFPGIERSDYNK